MDFSRRLLGVAICLIVAISVGTVAATAGGSLFQEEPTNGLMQGEPSTEHLQGESSAVTSNASTTDYSATLQDDSVTYLSPPTHQIGQEAHYRTGLDVSTAVSADVERLDGNFSKLAFEQRVDSLEIDEAMDAIVERIETLDRNYQDLLESYNAGEVSTATFLREFLRLEVAATQQRSLAVHVSRFTAGDGLPDAVNTEIVMLPDPIVENLEDQVRTGEGDSVYVQTTDTSVVLAQIDGEFLRQATLRDERDVTTPNQFQGDDQISLVNDRMNELYPWATLTGFQLRGSALYVVEMNHPASDLDLYLDGGTTNVFHEIQRVDPTALPVANTVTNSSDGLEVRVETTQPSGPMNVSVVDTTNGPERATVFLDGQRLGSTGYDGIRWVVQPTGSFDITVQTPDGRSVTVSVPS